jgi:hypothetical protein
MESEDCSSHRDVFNVEGMWGANWQVLENKDLTISIVFQLTTDRDSL